MTFTLCDTAHCHAPSLPSFEQLLLWFDRLTIPGSLTLFGDYSESHRAHEFQPDSGHEFRHLPRIDGEMRT